MSDHVLILLSLPLLLIVLATLWVMLRVTRHSGFSLRVSGLGVSVELMGGKTTNKGSIHNENTADEQGA